MTYVGITGHRRLHLDYDLNPDNEVHMHVCTQLEAQLRALQDTVGDITLITGVALGTDTFAALTAITLDIPFLAYIPCAHQDARWSETGKAMYTRLLKKAARLVQVSKEDYIIGGTQMQDRNVAMVEMSDIYLAVWNGTTRGGTYNCIKAVREYEVPLHVLDPYDLDGSFTLEVPTEAS